MALWPCGPVSQFPPLDQLSAELGDVIKVWATGATSSYCSVLLAAFVDPLRDSHMSSCFCLPSMMLTGDDFRFTIFGSSMLFIPPCSSLREIICLVVSSLNMHWKCGEKTMYLSDYCGFSRLHKVPNYRINVRVQFEAMVSKTKESKLNMSKKDPAEGVISFKTSGLLSDRMSKGNPLGQANPVVWTGL